MFTTEELRLYESFINILIRDTHSTRDLLEKLERRIKQDDNDFEVIRQRLCDTTDALEVLRLKIGDAWEALDFEEREEKREKEAKKGEHRGL